jgi:xylulose-5-phosphate/fructose-6-phosphate phosphoketolase
MNLTQSNKSGVAISAYGTARSTVKGAQLSGDELRKIDAYWRASLYDNANRSPSNGF